MVNIFHSFEMFFTPTIFLFFKNGYINWKLKLVVADLNSMNFHWYLVNSLRCIYNVSHVNLPVHASSLGTRRWRRDRFWHLHSAFSLEWPNDRDARRSSCVLLKLIYFLTQDPATMRFCLPHEVKLFCYFITALHTFWIRQAHCVKAETC